MFSCISRVLSNQVQLLRLRAQHRIINSGGSYRRSLIPFEVVYLDNEKAALRLPENEYRLTQVQQVQERNTFLR